MSSEFYVDFESAESYLKNKAKYIEFCKKLTTFVGSDNGVFEFKSGKSKENPWRYDVRLIFSVDRIVIDVALQAFEVYEDIRKFILFVRKDVDVFVRDDDGELIGWWN